MKEKYKQLTPYLNNNISIMFVSTAITFFLHRFHPELMQIIIDSGTFCGVVLLVIDEGKK